MKRFMLPIALFCSVFNITSIDLAYTTEQKSSTKQMITINVNLEPSESVFKESIHLSTDHPSLEITTLDIKAQPESNYLPAFKDQHAMYKKSFAINAIVNAQNSSVQNLDQHLYINFQTYPQLQMEEYTIPVTSLSSTKSLDKTRSLSSDANTNSQRYRSSAPKKETSILSFLQNMTQNTDSLWLRILLAFLLGLLLSLTPCIYPMIPITIGILHQSGKKSLFYNFLGSFSYASGLSTTFAILGLLAAFAGASFGSALSNPIFIIFIVVFLGYMSLTMIGVIDMYTPGFMKGNAQMNSKLGPFLSAFIFGLISGTIASPCVSPGLALLLTIVATLGSYFIGFIILFAFGMGMSTPLMIIATFSNSLSVLPQSGMWMVEVKRLLGFGMFMMCFYYLSNIIPFTILIWIIAAYVLAVALYYIISAQSAENSRTFKSFLGLGLLALFVFLCFKVYETNFVTIEPTSTIETPWADSYESALDQARQENKAVLLDFWANHCSICKAIDHKVFKNEEFITSTNNSIVLYKVDCTHSTKELKQLLERYKVMAQPNIILINPSNEEILQRWTSEPYSMPIRTFVQQISESIS